MGSPGEKLNVMGRVDFVYPCFMDDDRWKIKSSAICNLISKKLFFTESETLYLG